MSDKKISALTALATIAAGDLLVTVDVSDTTQAASGTTKKITVGEVLSAPSPIGSVTPSSGAFTTINTVVLSGASTPTLAVTGTTTVSGANTGDQTNITGNAATVTTNANLTGHVTSVGNAAVLGSFTSAQLAAALSDETGSGASVFATSPVLTTPNLGIPSAVVLTNASGTASININGTVGATTPSTIKVTTLTFNDATTQTTAGAPVVHTHAAADIVSGTVATARLGSGTASSGNFLRGDSAWVSIPGGGDMLAANNLSDLTNTTTAKTNLAIVPSDVGLGNVSNNLQLVAANNLSDLTNSTTAKTNLAIVPSDVGLGNVSNNLQLTAANNLSDLTNSTTARTNLSLGTMATQAASAVVITGGTINGVTGTASGFTAGNVTTNANLTGGVTSVGNAATVVTNANLTGDVTSVGNATAIAAGVIVDADINAAAAIADTKLATISTASKVSNSATTATNLNTASAIVARDASGDFTAGTITAALTGTASGNLVSGGALGTPSSGTVTNLTGTASININGTVGATTASTGAFTSLSSTIGSSLATSSGSVGVGTASPTTKLYVSGNSASNISALTDGTTITPDFSAANNFSVTLAGNRTLANPTGLIAGQSGVITITQDGTGTRTLAYGSYWDFAGGTAPTLSTAAAAQDVLVFFVTTSTRITCQMIANLS